MMPNTNCSPNRMTRPFLPTGIRVFAVAVVLGMLAGCATVKPTFPQPLRPPKAESAQDEVLGQATERKGPRVEEGPVIGKAQDAAPEVVRAPPDIPRTKPVSLVLDSVPLETFVNVVFGMELGFAVQVDQSLRSRPDLLSLRLTEPQSPEKAYSIAEEVLRNYGVRINELGGVLRFVPAGAQGGEVPTLIATRSLPDVPSGQRMVFVAMPLQMSQPGVVAAQVRSLFGTQSVTITEMVDANALLLSGPSDAVQAAMGAVTTLDRGALSNKRSIRITPLYLSADLLARELRDVLTGQGISVRSGPGTGGALTFVPVNSANALIIFSESEPALNAAVKWAEQLDQPSDDGAGGGMFLYAARHTTVETLLPVLEALIGGTATGGTQSNGGAGTGSGSGAATASSGAGEMGGSGSGTRGSGTGSGSSGTGSRVSSISGAGGQLAVDPVRNVIVFQGDAQRWRSLQGVLARLDQPARQVVIEVTVAEVTLTDEFSHGIEWALRNISVDGMSGPLTALAGTTSTGGLVWQGLSSSGQVKAVLNLFAKDSRVSILSTPRLLVKSGEVASIDVGTEVPIVTSQATAADLPNSGDSSSILQSIQYRKTGVLLEIEAVVHSGQRVDLKVTQEVSEATPTDTSDISSPSIFSRKLKTSLSLSDGESTLLGGLISSSRTDGKTKIPLLGDIPILGRAFQSRTKSGTRTELLMLITPYVVEDASQARAITDAIQARFGAEESSWPGQAPASPAVAAPVTGPRATSGTPSTGTPSANPDEGTVRSDNDAAMDSPSTPSSSKPKPVPTP